MRRPPSRGPKPKFPRSRPRAGLGRRGSEDEGRADILMTASNFFRLAGHPGATGSITPNPIGVRHLELEFEPQICALFVRLPPGQTLFKIAHIGKKIDAYRNRSMPRSTPSRVRWRDLSGRGQARVGASSGERFALGKSWCVCSLIHGNSLGTCRSCLAPIQSHPIRNLDIQA